MFVYMVGRSTGMTGQEKLAHMDYITDPYKGNKLLRGCMTNMREVLGGGQINCNTWQEHPVID